MRSRKLEALRADLVKIAGEHARPGRRARAARAVEERFARTALPRSVQRITVRGSGGAESLEQGFRGQREWTEHAKRALIARGYAAAEAELRAQGADRSSRRPDPISPERRRLPPERDVQRLLPVPR